MLQKRIEVQAKLIIGHLILNINLQEGTCDHCVEIGPLILPHRKLETAVSSVQVHVGQPLLVSL